MHRWRSCIEVLFLYLVESNGPFSIRNDGFGFIGLRNRGIVAFLDWLLHGVEGGQLFLIFFVDRLVFNSGSRCTLVLISIFLDLVIFIHVFDVNR